MRGPGSVSSSDSLVLQREVDLDFKLGKVDWKNGQSGEAAGLPIFSIGGTLRCRINWPERDSGEKSPIVHVPFSTKGASNAKRFSA